MRHARDIFAAALVGAAALTGCSTEGAGSIEEPLEAGTPVTITVPRGKEETITWEVVIDDMEEIPVLTEGAVLDWTDEDSYPDLTCWMITATLTQVEGPDAGTPIGVGGYGNAPMQPSLVGIQPDNTNRIPELWTACDILASDIAYNPDYQHSIYEAPGNGNSIKYYVTPPTTTSDRPTVVYVGNDGYNDGTASYVTIPEQP